MDTTARVGTAVAAGYLFGRFKKLRLALLVGTALASEDVRKSAVGLVTHGTSGLASGGAGRIAGSAGAKIIDAGRGVAVSAAASRLERLSDRLAERNEALGGPAAGPEDQDDADEYDDEDSQDDEYDDVEDDEDEEPEDDDEYADPSPPPTRIRRARRARALAPTAAGGR